MENSIKALKKPIRAALAVLLTGMLMKVINLPYAAGIIFTSFAAILILYAIRFSKKKNKKSIDFIKMALVLFWTTNGLLKILDFPYTLLFQIGTGLTFIAWFTMEGTAYFMGRNRKSQNSITDVMWNFIMIIGVLTIISGALMHLLGWEYSIPTLTVGLTTVTAFILKDIFASPKSQKEESNNEELYS